MSIMMSQAMEGEIFWAILMENVPLEQWRVKYFALILGTMYTMVFKADF